MAELTGTVRRTHDGAEYVMRLTMAGFAQLQSEFGNDFVQQLEGPKEQQLEEHEEQQLEGPKEQQLEEREEQQGPYIPPMGICLRIVEVALRKGMPDLDEARYADIADEIFTADPKIIGVLVRAAFPQAEEPESGNGEPAGKRRGKKAD